jgi:hypothetical protein
MYHGNQNYQALARTMFQRGFKHYAELQEKYPSAKWVRSYDGGWELRLYAAVAL